MDIVPIEVTAELARLLHDSPHWEPCETGMPHVWYVPDILMSLTFRVITDETGHIKEAWILRGVETFTQKDGAFTFRFGDGSEAEAHNDFWLEHQWSIEVQHLMLHFKVKPTLPQRYAIREYIALRKEELAMYEEDRQTYDGEFDLEY